MTHAMSRIELDQAATIQVCIRSIELLVECYMTGRKLTRVEAVQLNTLVKDYKHES